MLPPGLRALQWAAPGWETHEVLLAMALYETHAHWSLDVVAGAWKPLAQAPDAGPLQGSSRLMLLSLCPPTNYMRK